MIPTMDVKTAQKVVRDKTERESKEAAAAQAVKTAKDIERSARDRERVVGDRERSIAALDAQTTTLRKAIADTAGIDGEVTNRLNVLLNETARIHEELRRIHEADGSTRREGHST